MRKIGMGGESVEDRYVRELDPEQKDPGINVVAGILPKLLPGMQVSIIEKTNPGTLTDNTSRFNEFNILMSFQGKPVVGVNVTSETRERPRKILMEKFSDQPFVDSPFADYDLPRALIYVDPSQIAAYLSDQNIDQHPRLSQQILESFRLSLMIALGRTQFKPEQEQLRKLLAIVENRQKELGTKKRDSPQSTIVH